MKTLILTLFIAILCSCEQNKAISPVFQIGQTHEGGRIFYIFSPSDKDYVKGEEHGYVVSNDLGVAKWGCTGAPEAKFSDSGRDNTSIIVDVCGTNNASGVCINNGWWLPSIYEWQLLIKSNILTFDVNSTYWTSNKYKVSYGQYIRPSNGEIKWISVVELLKVRAIKQF